jgi:hypothetical protein
MSDDQIKPMLKELGDYLVDYLKDFPDFNVVVQTVFGSDKSLDDELLEQIFGSLEGVSGYYSNSDYYGDGEDIYVYYTLDNLDHIFNHPESGNGVKVEFKNKIELDFDAGIIEFDLKNKEFYFTNGGFDYIIEDEGPLSMKVIIKKVNKIAKKHNFKYNSKKDTIVFCYKKDLDDNK